MKSELDTWRSGLNLCRESDPSAFSLPPVSYTNQDIAELEVEKFFRGGWFGVGRADVVADQGDFITLDIAGQSIILLRDRMGKLRAFANTCRHRAARLLDGQGHCRGIRCPFHSWAYRLDGTLVAAPRMEAAAGFDKSDFGLIAYRAAERHGFAFLCLNDHAPPLDHVLDGFGDLHTSWPLDTLVSVRRREAQVDCNWKSFIEVFNEYYHLPFVHPDSVDELYNPPEPADEVDGDFASQFGSTEGTGGLLQTQQEYALPTMPGLKGKDANGVRYTWLFPNVTFAAGKDALWVYEAYPLTANTCKVVQTACFPPETLAIDGADEKLNFYLDRLDAALAEDVPALENQQRGFANPDARQGVIHPLLEANVASFSRWYSAKMSENSNQ